LFAKVFERNNNFRQKSNIGQKYSIEDFTANERIDIINNLKRSLGLRSITTVSVRHIPFSYALYLEIITKKTDLKQPKLTTFKLVFSGDCRPSEALTLVGRDCDLLIHESTFDNARFQEAITNNHSTMQEALSVSKAMNAKWTILTHFSARYAQISHIDDIDKHNVGFSFDFMYLNPSNINLINEINSLLKVLFRERLEENESKKANLINSKTIINLKI
jgi:ribonuclease Z